MGQPQIVTSEIAMRGGAFYEAVREDAVPGPKHSIKPDVHEEIAEEWTSAGRPDLR
ncbi:MAG TPA: hypothetical protein VN541_18880 [Tepidisphaeraceae bacterium]|nr:hypothetical protein [Tepidisphaeraceae bacterium]